jgi:dimeric dUTPase (all-alpha-NTP-PPase superfamily)
MTQMNQNRVLIPVGDVFELLVKQEELDSRIIKEHNISMSYEELVDKRKLAFIVELGEMSNEKRAFKYWSVKPESPKETILEEYVDGVHFVLSLGLLKGYGKTRIPQIELNFDPNETYNTHQIVAQTLDVAYYAVTLDYTTLLREYIRLGFMLGFTWKEIVQAYHKKNEKNHGRQDSGNY